MSSITEATHRSDALQALAAAGVGAVTFAVTMISGEVFDLNADPADAPGTEASDIPIYAGLVLLAVLIAVALAAWALAGPPRRVSGTALGLAIAAAVTYIGFWSGWPHVFGAVAVYLALEHRRRIGSLSGQSLIALVVGAVSFLAAAVTCVVG